MGNASQIGLKRLDFRLRPLGNVPAAISREAVIRLYRTSDIPIEERLLLVHYLLAGTEAFETPTLGEILPIARIDMQTIDKGALGSITAKLRRGLRRLIDSGAQSIWIYNRPVKTPHIPTVVGFSTRRRHRPRQSIATG